MLEEDGSCASFCMARKAVSEVSEVDEQQLLESSIVGFTTASSESVSLSSSALRPASDAADCASKAIGNGRGPSSLSLFEGTAILLGRHMFSGSLHFGLTLYMV